MKNTETRKLSIVSISFSIGLFLIAAAFAVTAHWYFAGLVLVGSLLNLWESRHAWGGGRGDLSARGNVLAASMFILTSAALGYGIITGNHALQIASVLEFLACIVLTLRIPSGSQQKSVEHRSAGADRLGSNGRADARSQAGESSR